MTPAYGAQIYVGRKTTIAAAVGERPSNVRVEPKYIEPDYIELSCISKYVGSRHIWNKNIYQWLRKSQECNEATAGVAEVQSELSEVGPYILKIIWFCSGRAVHRNKSLTKRRKTLARHQTAQNRKQKSLRYLILVLDSSDLEPWSVGAELSLCYLTLWQDFWFPDTDIFVLFSRFQPFAYTPVSNVPNNRKWWIAFVASKHNSGLRQYRSYLEA